MAVDHFLHYTGSAVLLLSLFGCASNTDTVQQTRVWDAYNACRASGTVATNVQIDRVEPDGRYWFRTTDGSHGRQELEACMRDRSGGKVPVGDHPQSE